MLSACFKTALQNSYENSVEQRKSISFLCWQCWSLPICHHVGTPLNERGRSWPGFEGHILLATPMFMGVGVGGG